jgi:excisionase family DNA binding protein
MSRKQPAFLFIRKHTAGVNSCFDNRRDGLNKKDSLGELSMNRLLSIPQFAELLGVTCSCIRRMVYERRINVIKVGRLVRISTAEYERIVAEGTRPVRQASEEEKCKR